MRLGVRRKLALAFSGLFLLLALAAGLGMIVIGRVSGFPERVLRDNLESIRACQEMGAAAERLQAALPGDDTAAVRAFETALRFQRGNVTVTGERQLTDSLAAAWEAYLAARRETRAARAGTPTGETAPAAPAARATPAYPASPATSPTPAISATSRQAEALRRAGDLPDRIAALNVRAMIAAGERTGAQARSARFAIVGLLAGGGLLSVLLLAFTGRSILIPLRELLLSAQEIERGNLDLVLEARSRDELGRLAEAFNGMAARLREFRRSDRAKLIVSQKAAQLAIGSLPDAVAVLGAGGVVEMSNGPASSLFGIAPGARVDALGLDWLAALFAKVRTEIRPFAPQGYEGAIQVFRQGEERFFLPQAIPILDEDRRLYGVTLVLADVTELRRLDESKSDLLSTVSHELKTRLTSVRMAVHLLLDEKIGEVNSRQAELLAAAREDAERLHRMIEGLLDIGRIRSGYLKMETRPTRPEDLVAQSVGGIRHAFQDKGLRFEQEIPAALPEVMADPSRACLILDNLLSNALKYTRPGGNIKVTASAEDGAVRFRVADTGPGIPAADLPRVFERFYRGSREGEGGGAGLGLAIAREVAEAHGGRVFVESTEGEGSVFSFTLPRAGA